MQERDTDIPDLRKRCQIMSDPIVLSNARLVLADEIVTGTLVIRDGLIAAIDTRRTRCLPGRWIARATSSLPG